jgi:hypothetical protein
MAKPSGTVKRPNRLQAASRTAPHERGRPKSGYRGCRSNARCRPADSPLTPCPAATGFAGLHEIDGGSGPPLRCPGNVRNTRFCRVDGALSTGADLDTEAPSGYPFSERRLWERAPMVPSLARARGCFATRCTRPRGVRASCHRRLVTDAGTNTGGTKLGLVRRHRRSSTGLDIAGRLVNRRPQYHPRTGRALCGFPESF